MRRIFKSWHKLAILLLISVGLVSSSFAKGKKDDKSRFENLELFNKVLYLIETSYYRKVDTEKLMEGAIKGMMSTLDPHSAYLSAKSFKKMQSDTQGELSGVGIEVTSKNGEVYIVSPIEDSPAFKAGLKPGDKIVEVKGESTLGMTLNEVIDKMQGKENTKVTLGIFREGNDEVKYFTLKREKIAVSPVKYQLLSNNYAYIRLKQFTKKASSSIVKSLKKMKKKSKSGLKGIVLDLRYNPGGLLDEAVNVASIFMKEGIVVSMESRDPKNKEIRYVNKKIHKETNLPLVVLINASSASASEIVAGALKDSKRGIIMGAQSFGKGSVQQVAQIDKKNGVKLTISQYMTPSGKKIQAIGITPDIHINEEEGRWVKDESKAMSPIREIDLKNHLTATIETPEEKALREKRERLARKRRKDEIRKKRDEDKKDVVRFFKFDPANDFQVLMAVSQLKAINIALKKK